MSQAANKSMKEAGNISGPFKWGEYPERHARRFTCWGQFVAMLFCQLGRAFSVREIIGGLRSGEGKLRHLGITAPSRSTLAYANEHRPWELYQKVYLQLFERWNPEYHEYELYLQVEGIEHTKTKTKSPQANGICERFQRTVLDEFYRVAFRTKVYRLIDELQEDLDVWLRQYNEERPHSGRYCYGKTPMHTFLDAIPMTQEKMIGYEMTA